MEIERIFSGSKDLDEIINLLIRAAGEGPHSFTIKKITSARSIPQNGSLHLYCNIIAGKMNSAGITQKELVGSFKEGFELPVTQHMIKDIFREVGKAMYKKKSTKKLTTVEIGEVYKVVDQRFGEICGVRSEWPSRNNYDS